MIIINACLDWQISFPKYIGVACAKIYRSMLSHCTSTCVNIKDIHVRGVQTNPWKWTQLSDSSYLHHRRDLLWHHIKQSYLTRYSTILPVCKQCKSINERYDDIFYVHSFMEICTRMEKTAQCPKVELIWEHLNDALHQVFLSYWVSTAHCLFKDSWKYMLIRQKN